MAGATATPGTIGGKFTHVTAFLPQPVITSQDGGRTNLGGFTGSGSATAPDSVFTGNGSATAISGTWTGIEFSEGLKQTPWTAYPGWDNFALGSCEPGVGYDNYQFNDTVNPPSSPFGGTFAYFDNEFNGGEAGPAQNAVRSGREWVTVGNDPAQGVVDLGSVKGSLTNQFTFPGWPPGNTAPPISAFGEIRSYMACVDPYSAIDPNTNPSIRYDASWDTYGFAHWDNKDATSGNLNISFECMFWTRNYNQGPFGFTKVETVNFGDGVLWDLYLWDNALDGGVAAKYSYGIFLMQPQFQTSVAWVDILAGIRYFAMHYVIPTGGAPSNPLNTPLWQIVRGWESCSTNYTPEPYRNLDYRLVIGQAPPQTGATFPNAGHPVRAVRARTGRGRVQGRR